MSTHRSTESAPGPEWLYLFSSNQSTLYVQDILNVMAGPDGLHYTFRYDAKYVEDATASVWDSLTPGTRVLVVFSVQQKAKFHPAVFLPVRMGTLVDAQVVGSRHFVRFALDTLVSLPSANDDVTQEQWVQHFTDVLRARVRQTPYEKSASLGDALPSASAPAIPWDAGSSPDKSFEQSVDYLAQTETFDSTRFYRLRRVAAVAGKADVALDANGVLPLHAGQMYDAEIVHCQRETPAVPETFLVDVDGVALQHVGRGSFEVASRYDRPTVRLVATPAHGVEARQTVVDIRGAPGVEGPAVTIPVRVGADKGKAVGVAAGQALALLGVALAGTLNMLSLGVRVGLAVTGALAAAALQLFGVAALRSPAMPTATKPSADGSSAGAHGAPHVQR